MRINLFLVAVIASLLVSCTDKDAYSSCRQTLEYSIEELSKASSTLDLKRIETQMNDTLMKYGKASMNREMIEEIKSLKNVFLQKFQERKEELNRQEILQEKRVVDMPGIGLVEIKSPPEV